MPKPKRVSKPSKPAPIQSISQGAAIQIGGTRLSPEEEKALNILLLRAAGAEDGMQLYKLGWALEDNSMKQDALTKEWKFDPEHKIPICLEPNQMSYHLLSWTPPNMTDLEHQHEFKGESFEKGTYACILHFLNTDGTPMNPTASLVEHIIPVLKEMHEIATATRKGFVAERNALRQRRIQRFKDEDAAKEKAYDSFSESLFNDTKPAFEGNPTSFPGPKGKSTADIIHTDELRDKIRPRNTRRVARTPSPSSFAFSAKTPKRRT